MAQLVINIPDEQVDRVMDALAVVFSYDEERDGPKAAFVKAQIIRGLRRQVLKGERLSIMDSPEPDLS